LRLLEALRLRIKDLDFANRQIVLRDGKGEKDRKTVLPASIVPALEAHLIVVKAIYDKDLLKDMALYSCRTHWKENISVQTESGSGSMFSQPKIERVTRKQA